MTVLTKILTGAAGMAAIVGLATPASAQYYPQPNSGGVLGTILNGVLGGGQQQGYGNYGGYGNNSQMAVNQCAGAVRARLQGQRASGYNGGYGGNWGGYGNNSYNNYSSARVTQITRVERRSNGGLKVYGLAQSAAMAQGGYNGGYNQGYGGYNQGYNQGYNGYNQGYNQGYGNQGGYADIKFNCKVDGYGRITDVDIDRNNSGYNNGYRGY